MTDHKLEYSIWVEAETIEEAEEDLKDLLAALFRNKKIADYDGPL